MTAFFKLDASIKEYSLYGKCKGKKTQKRKQSYDPVIYNIFYLFYWHFSSLYK